MSATQSTTARSIAPGSDTPWGTAENVTIFDNGIVAMSTSSHGGFYVPPHLNEQVPAYARAATWQMRGERGWYEEDVDWSWLALTFPHLFTQAERNRAAAMLNYFKTEAYRRFLAEKGGVQ